MENGVVWLEALSKEQEQEAQRTWRCPGQAGKGPAGSIMDFTPSYDSDFHQRMACHEQ